MTPAARRVAAAGLLTAILAVWAGAFAVPFQYDDLHTVQENPALRGGDFHALFSGLRPLSVLSLWIDFRLWGEAPAGFHATNLALHVANTCLVWVLAGRFAGAWGALFTAAAFALHPLQVEAVTYVSGRADLLAAFFMLAGSALFLGTDLAARRAGRWVLAGLGLAATLSKESGAVYPAWLLFLDWAWARRRKSGIAWRAHAWTFAAVLGAALAQAVWAGEPHLTRIIRASGGWQAALGYYLSQCAALPRYLVIAAWPGGLTINHELSLPFPAEGVDPSLPFSIGNFFGTAAAWWNVDCTRGVMTLGVMLGLLRIAAGSGWAWRLSAGWFVLQIAPAALVPLHDPFQEHRAYLSVAGLFLGAAIGLGAATGGTRPDGVAPRRFLASLAGGVILLWGAHTVMRNAIWQDRKRLWGEAVAVFPRNPRAHLNLGAAWNASGDPGRARRAHERALTIGGESDEMGLSILRNLFVAAVAANDIAAADGHMDRIRRLAGDDPERVLAVWGGARCGIDEPVCRWAAEGGTPPESVAWATRLVETAAERDASPALQGNLGSLLLLQARWDAAAFRFRSALAEHLRRGGADRDIEVELRISLAQALASSGRMAEAAEALAPVADDPRVAEILRAPRGPGR